MGCEENTVTRLSLVAAWLSTAAHELSIRRPRPEGAALSESSDCGAQHDQCGQPNTASRDESMTRDMHGPRTCLAIEHHTANGCDVMFTESSIHSCWSSYV